MQFPPAKVAVGLALGGAAGVVGRKLGNGQRGTPAPVGHDRGPACRRNDRCPCGSGKKAKRCCRRAS